MKNKEIIQNFKNSYIKNMIAYSDYNDSLFLLEDYNDWKKNLLDRSRAIREMFKENEENILLIHKILKEDFDSETALMLMNLIKEFKENEIHDASINIDIINRLIEFYEKKGNYNNLIQLYNLGALEEMEFFLRMDISSDNVNPVDKYLKVLKLKEKYKELTPTSRRSVFIAYYNLTGPIPDLMNDYRKNIIGYYKDAISFYNSDLVQSIDKDNEEIADEISYINDMMITGFYYFLNSDQKDEYFKIADEILSNYDIDENEKELISLAKRYYLGEINLESLVDSLYNLFIKYFGDGLKYDGTDDNLNEYCICNDIATILFDLLKNNNIIDEEKKYKYLYKIGYSLLDYIDSVPYKEFTSYFDDISADLFKNLLSFCKTFEQKEDLLTKLVLRRQPITYIHSIMVERISVAIAKEMINRDIHYFDDLIKLGYDTKEKILNYISKAAYYHDLGKCLTVGVINLQNRKLTDTEFKYIKLHPEKSKVLLNNDESFNEYYDVMLGHHRTYDGKGGYPMSFNNLNSPYKFAIDLISIADSTDAATDILGRNYATGKNFNTLLEELNESKGTRYNPVIVDYINSDEELKKYLDDITGIKRIDLYYDVYQRILNERKNNK